ncbi:hypothetical protein [Rhodoferax fermentans]|uniref:hypothetical protein n=1 Tax=Rhodoferax fermentans TaxID=28066 RepID=UPI00117AE4A5|nr:hypothetical protein [Rhodoferax fermentans]
MCIQSLYQWERLKYAGLGKQLARGRALWNRTACDLQKKWRIALIQQALIAIYFEVNKQQIGEASGG